MIRPLGSSQSSSLKNARSAYSTPTGNIVSARTAASMASSNTAQNRTKVRGCGKAQKIKTTVTNFGNNVKTGWQNMSTDQKVTFCIAIALGVGITVMTFGAAAPVVGTGIAFMAAGAAGVGFSAGFYDMASYENPTTVERDTAMGAATGASIAGDILMVGSAGRFVKGITGTVVRKATINVEKKVTSGQMAKIVESNSENIHYANTGEYAEVGGHHVHAKAAFKGHINYDPQKGFSISQDFMEQNGLNHQKMTSKQRELFKELYESGRPNTLAEHTKIAREALKAGGADNDMINILISDSLSNLSKQGVFQPTRIPWYTK